ncbi:MAG: hypothetical protein KC592_15305 [Nitrospira sp.]|nr:hypothetical protein [Nitrospira sp.]MCW5783044.1 hypothetical protein [Nitrospirales bacterium]
MLHILEDSTKAIVLEELSDEYKAQAFYRLVLNTFGEIRPFSHKSGGNPCASACLCGHSGIPLPKDDWQEKLDPISSVREACRADVQGEHDNIAMYDRFLRQTRLPEVLTIFQRLQAASRQHHLPSFPAFERCAARGGQTGRRAMSLGQLRAGRPGQHGRQSDDNPCPHPL